MKNLSNQAVGWIIVIVVIVLIAMSSPNFLPMLKSIWP